MIRQPDREPRQAGDTRSTSTVRYRLREGLKTVLIFVLIVLMIVLLMLLMLGQGSAGEGTRLPANRMVVYTAGAETGYTKGMDTSRVLPTTLYFREADDADGTLRCLTASAHMEKPYASLYTLYRTLFGADSHCTRYEGEAAAALLRNSMAADTCIAVSYGSALPPSVIRAYTFDEDAGDGEEISPDETPDGDAVYVRDVIFVEEAAVSDLPVQPDRICAVTRDDDGNAALFSLTPPQDVSEETDTVLYAQRSTAAMADASALSVLSSYTAALSTLAADAQTVYAADITHASSLSFENDGIYRLPCLQLYAWDPGIALFSADKTEGNAEAAQADTHEKAAAVLALLGMDEGDTDNYYNDNMGGRVYLNADGRLRLSRDGMIRYTALQGGGIPIAEYLGYASVGGSYLLSEYLRACDRMLGRLAVLDAALGGGDADISLSAVYASQGSITIRYVYTYNGVPLRDETGTPLNALSVTCAGGCVTALSWAVRYVQLPPGDGTIGEELGTYLLPQSVVRRAMEAEARASGQSEDAIAAIMDGTMVIAYLPDRADPAALAAQWILENRRTHK